MPTETIFNKHEQIMIDLPLVYRFCRHCEKIAVVNVFSKDDNCGFCKKHFKKYCKELPKKYAEMSDGDK